MLAATNPGGLEQEPFIPPFPRLSHFRGLGTCRGKDGCSKGAQHALSYPIEWPHPLPQAMRLRPLTHIIKSPSCQRALALDVAL